MMIPKIKTFRKYKNMTQKELADAINVDTSVISKYESGKISPSYDRLQQISEVLGVNIDALLTNPETFPVEERRRMYLTSVDDDRYVASESLPAKELLEKAGNVCELCGSKMPIVQNGSTWFMEPHFIEWLSKGGSNTVDNIIILCPSCHKYIHMLSYEESIAILNKAMHRR